MLYTVYKFLLYDFVKAPRKQRDLNLTSRLLGLDVSETLG